MDVKDSEASSSKAILSLDVRNSKNPEVSSSERNSEELEVSSSKAIPFLDGFAEIMNSKEPNDSISEGKQSKELQVSSSKAVPFLDGFGEDKNSNEPEVLSSK